MGPLQLNHVPDAILEVQDEGNLLAIALRTALYQRHTAERLHIWAFAYSLCESCNPDCEPTDTIIDSYAQTSAITSPILGGSLV